MGKNLIDCSNKNFKEFSSLIIKKENSYEFKKKTCVKNGRRFYILNYIRA